VHHVLAKDAARIKMMANKASSMRIQFPSYLPSFDNCEAGAVMCCHVADRQANDAAGLCNDGEVCSDAEPEDNTDVCLANMADSPVTSRVQRGLAVYNLNRSGDEAEGNVNCHGFAWDSAIGHKTSTEYKGNMLFDVAFKQSLYDKGYVKNVPGSPMCGCIEKMPTVTRADCTKIVSVSETITLSAKNTEGTLLVEMTDADVQYGPCDEGGDLASHYKKVNALNNPGSIDAKLVGEGKCYQSIDSRMASYGYKRSVLKITDAYFSPSDVSPPRLTIKFNSAVANAASALGSYKVYDAANPSSELTITAAELKSSNTLLEFTLSDSPSVDRNRSYEISNLVTLRKQVAPMVTLMPLSSTSISFASWDYLEFGGWRIGRTCETCGNSHFSVSADTAVTSVIYRDTGTIHQGQRTDYNPYGDLNDATAATYSVNGVRFGNRAVQVRDWRIKQIDNTHISISHKNGNVSRIFRSDGTSHGRVNTFSGWNTDLGAPTCAYLTSNYLQIGDWRFGRYDATHMSVSHRLGFTSMIYRSDGTAHDGRGRRRDYNMWLEPDEEILLGSKEGCAPLSPSEPNVLQIGNNWKLGQMYDKNHFSVSAKQDAGLSNNAAKTAIIYRHDGKAFSGPRSDYNAWGEVPTYSNSPPRFGYKTLEIDQWHITQVDLKHLSISHTSGGVSRVYRADGSVFSQQPAYSGWASDQELESPTCAFRTEKFVQIGDWRIGEHDATHLSVSHASGQTSMIYRRDGKVFNGPRTDYGTWDFPIGAILEGSADGCVNITEAMFMPNNPPSVMVKFNRPVSEVLVAGLASSFKVYDNANPETEFEITSAAVNGESLELSLATVLSSMSTSTYQLSTIREVSVQDPLEVIPPGITIDIVQASWDYIEIGNWRIAHTCEQCSNSHFSISSDNIKTSQIFRDTGSTHKGPRSDFNGWDAGVSGPTFSTQGIIFGNKAVQVRDWRIRQIDNAHMSVSHKNGNVSRIYRSDGTLHGNVRSFSGWNNDIGAPSCAYLTENYLQIGDWRFGKIDGSHLSVSHKGGKTAVIYRRDGTLHGGPRTDYNGWNLPDGDVIMGSNNGCGNLFG